MQKCVIEMERITREFVEKEICVFETSLGEEERGEREERERGREERERGRKMEVGLEEIVNAFVFLFYF